MRGVLGVEVTEDGVGSTALEIFETGAKIPEGPNRQMHDECWSIRTRTGSRKHAAYQASEDR